MAQKCCVSTYQIRFGINYDVAQSLYCSINFAAAEGIEKEKTEKLRHALQDKCGRDHQRVKKEARTTHSSMALFHMMT